MRFASSAAHQQGKIARLTRERDAALEQQTATSEVLHVNSTSRGELEPVFQIMPERAVRICEAKFGALYRFDGNALHLAAQVGASRELAELRSRRGPFQPTPGGLLDLVLRTKRVNYVADQTAGPSGPATKLGGHRTTHDLRIYPAPAPPATNREIDEFELAQQLVGLQEAAESSSPAEQQQVLQSAQAAADQINLDEAETRALVDEQLRERGWEADTQSLRYAKGVRPARGKAMAIAEWPTANGPADYALFVGLTCVGLVEAKRKRKNVAAAIDQTGRYAQAFSTTEDIDLPSGGPWPFQSGPTEEKPFRVPFLFATNGRPYVKQVETQSGIWFCDARDPTNLRRALTDWPTPEGLKAQLDIDRQAAQERLQSMPIEFARPPPWLQRAEPNTVTFDSRSEEGEILIRWGFKPMVLGYIPNVRGAVTGVP